jgi:hypothetical protein
MDAPLGGGEALAMSASGSPPSRERQQLFFGSGSRAWREQRGAPVSGGLRRRLRQVALGLALGAVGMAYMVSDRPVLPLALLGAAAALLALGALAAPRELAMWVTRRPYLVRLTNTLYSIAGAALVVAAVGLVDRAGVRWDLAAGARLSAAEETVRAARTLPAPPEMAFYPPPDMTPEDFVRGRDLLDDVAARVPGSKVVVVDPLVDPAGATGAERLAEGELGVVRSGGRAVRLVSPLGELQLRAAFERLARGGGAVCSLVGHGERETTDESPAGLSAFASVLARGGRDVRTVEGANELAGCDVVVIAGAARPLAAPEVEALAGRLDAGGRLLMFLEPDAPTGLEALLRVHGIDPLGGVLEDASATDRLAVAGVATAAAPVPGEGVSGDGAAVKHAARGAVARLHGARPLAVWGDAAAVVVSGPDVVADDAGVVFAGPFALAASAQWGAATGAARLVVFADADVATNASLAEGANLDLVMGAVDWLGVEASRARAPGGAPAAVLGSLGDYAPGAWAFVSSAFLIVGLLVRRSWGRR